MRYGTISRKKLVTSLVHCSSCALRFRIPQDAARHYFDFYQTAYTSSLATECPAAVDLQGMLATEFRGTEKNFAPRIQVLQALGIKVGSKVLDYGASWGYATWQFINAGYEASGYEISRPRAAYAREKLEVRVVDDVEDLPRQHFDCMFSCHVLEHVPSPKIAFDLAKRVLKPGGLFVAFTPNGSDASRVAYPDNYNHSWGRLHPLYLNAEFYQQHFKSHSWLLTSANYGEPYKLDVLRSWNGNGQLLDDVSGRELLAIVRF